MHREVIGDCEIWLGDNRDVLPLIGSVDHLISDPPYEKEAHRSDRRVTNKNGVVPKPLTFEAIGDRRNGLARLCAEASNGWMILFCQAEGVAPWRDAIEAAGAKYKAPMIWVKPDGMPQLNGQGPGMGYESLVSAWCGKGRSYWNGGGRHGVFIIPKGEGAKPVHETQKPVRLMSELVSLFTRPGETVLDPWCGSGTTLVACAKLGRKGIGIELDPDYFEIACKRVRDAYAQPDLFVPAPSKPVQEGMDL